MITSFSSYHMCTFVHVRSSRAGVLTCFGTVQAAMNTTLKKKDQEWGPQHRTLGKTKMEWMHLHKSVALLVAALVPARLGLRFAKEAPVRPLRQTCILNHKPPPPDTSFKPCLRFTIFRRTLQTWRRWSGLLRPATWSCEYVCAPRLALCCPGLDTPTAPDCAAPYTTPPSLPLVTTLHFFFPGWF